MTRVVIVGGGVAGHRVAHDLQGEAEIVLVEAKDHLEVPMATPRALVVPKVTARSLLPFETFLPEVERIEGRAEGLTRSSVAVRQHDDRQIYVPWNILVVATGAAYGDPRIVASAPTLEERQAQAVEVAARLQTAKRVLIIGGGPVGVEVAAELCSDLPNIEVTLVHAGPRILHRQHRSVSERAERWLLQRDVRILTKERVVFPPRWREPGTVLTESAKTLSYDLVFRCMAGRPNSRWLEGLLPDAIDDRGAVKVDPHLRVKGHPRVFALGDVTDLPERKMGMYAGKHVDVVVDNILALLKGGEGGLATYEPAEDLDMALSLGRTAGVVRFRNITVPSLWFGRWVKGRDVFVPRYRARVGLR